MQLIIARGILHEHELVALHIIDNYIFGNDYYDQVKYHQNYGNHIKKKYAIIFSF